MRKEDFVDFVLRKNGYQFQTVICVEELAELAKELCKYIRGQEKRDRIAEEVADVVLCLTEVQKMFDISALEVEERIKQKIDRYLSD